MGLQYLDGIGLKLFRCTETSSHRSAGAFRLSKLEGLGRADPVDLGLPANLRVGILELEVLAGQLITGETRIAIAGIARNGG